VDPLARRVGLRLGGEAVRVARALNVQLVTKELFDVEPEVFLSPIGSLAFEKLEANYRTEYESLKTLRGSMLQDIEKGRPTEIDYMSGYIVRQGAKLGIPAPANEIMLSLVRDLEAGRLHPDRSLLQRFSSVLR